jgi:hypothetical protein
MTAFNFLSGSVDPNSLPALLRQRMAPGLIPGPVQPMPLTSGFRAPALPPSMGFRAMPQLPPVPDFKVQNGPGILDKLLSRFPLPGIDPNGGIMNLDGSSGWGAPAGGGAIDPLTGLLQDLGFGGGVETGGLAGAAAAGADAAAGGAAAGGAAAAGTGAAGAGAAGFSIADLLPFLLAA